MNFRLIVLYVCGYQDRQNEANEIIEDSSGKLHVQYYFLKKQFYRFRVVGLVCCSDVGPS